MKRVVGALNPAVAGFEASCFDGVYVTGDIDADVADANGQQRRSAAEDDDDPGLGRLALASSAGAS
jgi:amidophosphoribosyltransferase